VFDKNPKKLPFIPLCFKNPKMALPKNRRFLGRFKANNPVVDRSSAEFDALFGRQMMGLSLDKAWVAHHLGRQQLKGAEF